MPTSVSTSTAARRAFAVALGAAAGAAVRLLAQLVHGDVVVGAGSTARPVALWQVLAAALVAGLAGWGLLALAERRSPRLASRWPVLAGAVTLLSLGGPLGMAGIAAADRAWLCAMHLAVAAGAVPLLASTLRTHHERPSTSTPEAAGAGSTRRAGGPDATSGTPAR